MVGVVVAFVVAVAVAAVAASSVGGGHRERFLALLGGLRPHPNPMPTGVGFILPLSLATCQLLSQFVGTLFFIYWCVS